MDYIELTFKGIVLGLFGWMVKQLYYDVRKSLNNKVDKQVYDVQIKAMFEHLQDIKDRVDTIYEILMRR